VNHRKKEMKRRIWKERNRGLQTSLGVNRGKLALHVGNQGLLVLEGHNGGVRGARRRKEGFGVSKFSGSMTERKKNSRLHLERSQLLVAPHIERHGTACESSVIPKRSHSAALLIVQELHVQQHSISSFKACQELLPALLVLVAVAKEDVAVLQRRLIVLWQLLQPNNEVVLGRSPPRASLNKLTASTSSLPERE